MSDREKSKGPNRGPFSEPAPGKPASAPPRAPEYEFESDALLNSLLETDAEISERLAAHSYQPPRTAQTPPPELDAEPLTPEEFEEVASNGSAHPQGPVVTHAEIETTGDDDIDALLAHTAPDSEPVHTDWDPPTAPALAPYPTRSSFPTGSGSPLTDSRAPSITKTAPFSTRLDHAPLPSTPPNVAETQRPSAEPSRASHPSADPISRQITLPDSDLEAPTRIERMPSRESLPGLVELRADSFASIHDAELDSAPDGYEFGRPHSFASIQDEELIEDEAGRNGGSRPDVARSRPDGSQSGELDRPIAQAKWLARAEQMELEAQAKTDPHAKARALLVASELWALGGELTRARQAAALAATAARPNSLTLRQQRWLAAADGDWKNVVTVLDAEAKSAASPEARAHAAYFSAEISRLTLDDEAAAQRKLEAAMKANPSDPRPHVSRLAAQLAKTSTPPRSKLPEGPAFASLNRATEELAELRGGPSGSELGNNPKVLFQAARRALALGDRNAAANALVLLGRIPGLERPSQWLAATLFAPLPEQRPRAIAILRELLGGPEGVKARRALAARGLEQDDAAAVRAALEPEDDEKQDAFSPSDRVALTVLAFPEPSAEHAAGLEPWLNELALDENQRPLASAALSIVSSPHATLRIQSGGARAQSELTLARALLASAKGAGSEAELAAAFEGLSNTHGAAALGRVLALELALRQRQGERVASALGEWSRDGDRDRHMAAALVFELSGSLEAATREYTHALTADPGSEATVRALLSRLPPEAAVEHLTALAEVCRDNAQAALLLVEAALRLGSDDPKFARCVERAADAEPSLPFAHRLGEQLARSSGDATGLLKWLRQRKDVASDAIERAFDLVREALLVADEDMRGAASLLDEALKARPSDVALHELYERLNAEVNVERGRWREQVAEQTEGALKLRLLLEAALEYERAGDAESAARAALLAAEAKDSDFARVIADRAASSGTGAARLSERLFSQARAEQDPRAQRELYERLSALDRIRGDSSSALLWHSAILERTPDHMPALRRLEHAYIGSGRDEALEPIASALAPLLDRNEASAHAWLTARLRARSGAWAMAREAVELAAKLSPPPLWALREASAHARAAADDARTLELNRALSSTVSHALDAATLALRGAEAAARLDKLADADALLARATELVPEHLVAREQHAEILERAGDYAGSANAFELVADLSHLPEQRLNALHRAGVLWLDRLSDLERAQSALERAAEIESAPEDVFARLQAVYVAKNDRTRLAALLERRLQKTTDPEQRIVLEVTRGRALSEIGDREAARRALLAALDANPDHTGALAAFAELCTKEGDHAGAEQALIRLARHVSDNDEQAEIYRRLGQLYESELANPERAELAYKEVLKRRPDDLQASERLVYVYGKMGNPARAIELQNELIARAETPERKRDATLGLALAYEQIVGDRRKAEATFDKARKAWSHDSVVLRALAEFYRRSGEHAALGVLLDRAAAEARRALHTGRFDAAFFETLAAVAELREQGDLARVARATLASLHGDEAVVSGAGARAGDPKLDELLAPDLLSPAFRALLRKCGESLDAAYPLDLKALRASPLAADGAALVASVERLAASFGFPGCEVFTSPVLAHTCVAASSGPARIVVGAALADSQDEAGRYFLIVRALKILQSRTSVLARTAPIELWPVLAGLLSLLAVGWQPQGVDGRRLADAQQRLKTVLPARSDDELKTLAFEVTGAIGNRASQLATAVNQWGNRCALLALGDPTAATRALAMTSGNAASLPAQGSERLKWIVRNPETRDLAVFSVSEQYAEARRQLGLTG